LRPSDLVLCLCLFRTSRAQRAPFLCPYRGHGHDLGRPYPGCNSYLGIQSQEGVQRQGVAEAVVEPAAVAAVGVVAGRWSTRIGASGFPPHTAGESRDVGFRADRAPDGRYSVR